MPRQYLSGPGESDDLESAGAAIDLRGVRERHWALLALLAERGSMDSSEAAELMFGSRSTAARHLQVLLRAGLADKFVLDNDPTHRAFFAVSFGGEQALIARMRAAGRAVSVSPVAGHRHQGLVNDVYLTLIRASRASSGRAWLYGWRRGVDVVAGLQRLGICGVQPRAAGVWLEDDRALRFLLHIDEEAPDRLGRTPTLTPAQGLDGYRHSRAGVPAGCLLVLTSTRAREFDLHDELLDAPLPVPVASATLDRFAAAGDASAAIWTCDGDATALVRLIDTFSAPA